MDIKLNDNETRSFPVTVFVLNDDGTHGAYRFENFLSATRDLKSEIIIGMIADDQVMDLEITYTTAQAHDCKDSYSKSIFWNRKTGGK